MKQKSEYDIQAEEFAAKIGLTMTATYIGHFGRLAGTATGNYQIDLTRGKRTYSFQFSTSVSDSWEYRSSESGGPRGKGLPPRLARASWPKTGNDFKFKQYFVSPVATPPTLYSVLACLTKSDPGSFSEFCSEFGFDEDSRAAEKTWRAVTEEWLEVDSMFHDCLEELQEIN